MHALQTGYREGITAGKLSTLQQGFDQGFNEVGASLGRQLGALRGQLAALLLLTSSPTSTSPSSAAAAGRRAPARSRGLNATPTAGAGAGTLPLLASPRLEQARLDLRGLAKELDAVTLDTLAEPDWEAIEHESEHQDGGVEVTRETQHERAERELLLQHLNQRLQSIRQMLGLRPLQL